MYMQKLFIYFININTWIYGICRGASIVGNFTSLIGIPEVTIPSKAVLIPYGGNVKLTCYVTSVEPVSISWIKTNRQLPIDKNSNKYHIEHIADSEEHETSLITIHNVSKSDIGEYHCVANNSYGTVANVATLYGFVRKETPCVSNEIKTSIEIGEIKENMIGSTGSASFHCKNSKMLTLIIPSFIFLFINRFILV